MEETIKRRVMLFCASVLVLASVSVVVRFFTTQVVAKTFRIHNEVTNAIVGDDPTLRNFDGITNRAADKGNFDWALRYPFTEKSSQSGKASKNTDVVRHWTGKCKSIESKIQEWTGTHFWKYMSIVSFKSVLQEKIGWNIVPLKEYNGVITLEDGQLTGLQAKTDVTGKIQNVVAFSEVCHEQGIQFLMVLAPNKIARSDTEYAGRLDFSNENSDAFLEGLKEKDVEFLDLRENVKRDGLLQHELFYRTDPHWTGETGRWAAQQILLRLNQDYGYEAETSLQNPEQYTETLYPSWFLGSQGRKLTMGRVTPDDFVLYYPKFETSFHMVIPSLDIDTQGDFTIMYNMDQMDLSRGYYQSSAYHTYGFGDRALITVHNDTSKDGTKLLMIHDSFADVVTPFLALGMEELASIDLRHFTGSLQTYLQKERPDTVLLLYNAGELTAPEKTDAHTGLFDFR